MAQVLPALPILFLLLLMLHDVVRRPTIRRLAARNVVRRRGEAVLVVAGSLLGTALILASMIVGDTIGASIRDFGRTELGPIDMTVRVNGLARLPEIEKALAAPVPGTDGTLRMIAGTAALKTPGADPLAEPAASLLEVDFDQARRFGGDVAATGMGDAGPTPTGNDAVIGTSLADALDLRVGDSLQAFAYGQRRDFRISRILPKVGLIGFAEPALFVAPGTVAALAGPLANAGEGAGQVAPPNGMVLVSNTGGVFEGVDRTSAVDKELRARLDGISAVEVNPTKADLLEDADDTAAQFREIFGTIGGFGVIAGILLLINIFVMLADERKPELGMLRAVGLKRNQLVRSFGLEGGIYALVSSLVGVLVGVGVGRIIVVLAQGVFNQGEDEFFQLSLRFTAEPATLAAGFLVGMVISLVTVWGSSVFLARLNIIRAIRDIAEPAQARQRVRSLVLGSVGVLLGAVLFASGLSSNPSWFGAMVGVPLVAVSTIPLLSRLLPRRAVVSVACIAALAWQITAFSILPDALQNPPIAAFLVQGVSLVAAAVALGAVNADIVGHVLLSRVLPRGRSLSTRLALAYPVARRFRTAMLLFMYALVIFTLTFLAVMANLFGQQAPRFAEETRAGYDVIVESNPANPVSAETLVAQPEVTAVTPLLRGFPEWSHAEHPEPAQWALTGYDESLFARGVPKLADRGKYTTDRAAWDAVLADPNLLILSDFFLSGGGPPESVLEPGDKVRVYNRTTGEERELTVAGMVTSDWVFNGVFVGAPFARDFLGPEVYASRYYAALEPGLDPDVAAQRLQGRLLEHGVEADAFLTVIRSGLEQQQGFFRLMEGYLGLALLVGIAGLGVVMVRAVRERRRQIGMLRAMGFPHGMVRTAFLVEAGFIAVQGVLIGVALAIISSYQLLSNTETFGEGTMAYEVPWSVLAIVLTVALVASVLATAGPANQASRIKPAVALRIAD
jgi:putative ABC transport system permease protein